MTFVLVKNPSLFYFSDDKKGKNRDDEEATLFFPTLRTHNVLKTYFIFFKFILCNLEI